MNTYQSKFSKVGGKNYKEVLTNARAIYGKIEKRTKRQPYIRSVYFGSQKIFFNLFWNHLYQKPPKERYKRLKYFQCAIDLIEKTRDHPTMKQNPNRKEEILYRFSGQTCDKEQFAVQIKENVKNQKKYFMSVFPWK